MIYIINNCSIVDEKTANIRGRHY